MKTKNWEFKGVTVGGGKLYHKDRNILVVYDNISHIKFRLHKNVPINKEFIPYHAAYELEWLYTNLSYR